MTGAVPGVPPGGLVLPAAAGWPSVLLLHGRAGDERQLLPLLRAAGRPFGALAPRGPIALPDGFAWCRRHAVGLPCCRSLAEAAEALADWLERALERSGVDAPVPAVAYSSGAMAVVALAAARPDLVREAVLVRGAVLLPKLVQRRGLAGARLLLLGGQEDRVLPPSVLGPAARLYRAAGARVTLRLLPGAGHGVRPEDARAVRGFLREALAA